MDKESVIKHYGVLGMKWGVRRDRSGQITVRDRLKSLSRERQWKKVIGNVDNLSTEDISKLAKRVGLENDLKRLAKGPAGKKKDKADYVKRDQIDDESLNRKVMHLRAKENLIKQVSNASKEQRELGEKIVNASGNLAIAYAKNKSLTPKDLFDAITDPKDIGAVDVIKEINKNRTSK